MECIKIQSERYLTLSFKLQIGNMMVWPNALVLEAEDFLDKRPRPLDLVSVPLLLRDLSIPLPMYPNLIAQKNKSQQEDDDDMIRKQKSLHKPAMMRLNQYIVSNLQRLTIVAKLFKIMQIVRMSLNNTIYLLS